MCAATTSSSKNAEATSKALPGRQPQSANLVIFGAGGDLTKRLVVPALYHLVQAGKLPKQLAIIGIDRNQQSSEQWRQNLTNMMQTLTPAGRLDAPAWSWLTDRMQYMAADFTQSETFQNLKGLLVQQREQNGAANILFYLAVAERFFGPIVEQLGHAGLTQQSEGAWRRVIIEKPFGHDLSSAKVLNAQILRVLTEDQIYRIDHFLGKETVQNILVLRFANGIFEPLWNRDHIDHVQITAAETVGVEGSLLRTNWGTARHGAEPSIPTPCHDRDGAAHLIRCRRGAHQKDRTLAGDPSRFAGERSTRPVRR